MTSLERACETPVFRKLGGFKLNGLGPTAMPVCRCSLGALRRVSVTFGIRPYGICSWRDVENVFSLDVAVTIQCEALSRFHRIALMQSV